MRSDQLLLTWCYWNTRCCSMLQSLVHCEAAPGSSPWSTVRLLRAPVHAPFVRFQPTAHCCLNGRGTLVASHKKKHSNAQISMVQIAWPILMIPSATKRVMSACTMRGTACKHRRTQCFFFSKWMSRGCLEAQKVHIVLHIVSLPLSLSLYLSLVVINTSLSNITEKLI